MLTTHTDIDREHMRDEADRKRVHDALDTLERIADDVARDGITPREAVAALDAAQCAYERTQGSTYAGGAALHLRAIESRVLCILVHAQNERERAERAAAAGSVYVTDEDRQQADRVLDALHGCDRRGASDDERREVVAVLVAEARAQGRPEGRG